MPGGHGLLSCSPGSRGPMGPKAMMQQAGLQYSTGSDTTLERVSQNRHCMAQVMTSKRVAEDMLRTAAISLRAWGASLPFADTLTSHAWPRQDAERYSFESWLRLRSRPMPLSSCTCLCRLRNCFADFCLDGQSCSYQGYSQA